ncbi:hypothetical protein BJ912DRAFT_1038659 [Pholiota molesta]|nr:hypothetical protein BJ912DRAFT_1038659 [Pholiota molesta]
MSSSTTTSSSQTTSTMTPRPENIRKHRQRASQGDEGKFRRHHVREAVIVASRQHQALQLIAIQLIAIHCPPIRAVFASPNVLQVGRIQRFAGYRRHLHYGWGTSLQTIQALMWFASHTLSGLTMTKDLGKEKTWEDPRKGRSAIHPGSPTDDAECKTTTPPPGTGWQGQAG